MPRVISHAAATQASAILVHRDSTQLRARAIRARAHSAHLDLVTLASPLTPRPRQVRRVIDLVQAHPGRRFTLVELGQAVHCSPWHLNVLFHRWMGMTIHAYATSLRMADAMTRIAAGENIETIARRLGYRSRDSFYRQFRSHFLENPGFFRHVT